MNVAMAKHAEECRGSLEIAGMDNSIINLKARARFARDAVAAAGDNMVQNSGEWPENGNSKNVAVGHFHFSATIHIAGVAPQAGEIIGAAELPVRRLVVVVQIGQKREIDSVHGNVC